MPELHAAVAARLRCQDQDQEVKECAIAAAAMLAADLGDLLPRQLPDLLQARAHLSLFAAPQLTLSHSCCLRLCGAQCAGATALALANTLRCRACCTILTRVSPWYSACYSTRGSVWHERGGRRCWSGCGTR